MLPCIREHSLAPAHRSRRRRPQEIHPNTSRIQTVGEAAPAHRSRRRRPQEIHTDTVGEAAPPSAGISEYTGKI